jgi:hypothetical protein
MPRATWFLKGSWWWFITLLVSYCMTIYWCCSNMNK